MMRPAVSLFTAALLATLAPPPSHAQTIYRWLDAKSGVHYSNEPSRTPEHASAVELAPLGTIQIPVRKRTRPGRRPSATPPPAAPCGPADPTGLMSAIGAGLVSERPDERLTLLVGGVPLTTSADATVTTLVTRWDPDEPQAHLSQSAIAYPVGSSCPTAPPLVRYPTNGRREAASRGLCDDYRRAFAQVGVATSRDAGIARSFRDIARSFLDVQLEGNVAIASGFRAAVADGMLRSDATVLAPHVTVPLDPWIVKAHVAQTERLASESDHLVDQLTVALEEIDRAARATGCWN
ncbi:MAG: DUF4124 domain-containing protein [Deltaproteobacteria bacterium]|nr:DUF4124 domain-containing protein [Deltaproteobacteria bacterium]